MRQCLFLGLALLPSPLHGVTAPPLACLRCRGGGRDGERPKPRSRDFGHSVHAAASKLCQSSRPLLLAAKKPAAPKPIPLARHMRGIVFGGMDGILTTFALLAAVAGSGGTSPALTLVIGISTVLADGLSMGAGEYLSAKAEAEIATGGDEEETTPLEKGFAMFVAFTLFGAMPLLGFLLTELLASGTGPGYHFQLSVAITAFTLFALGTVKSTFGAGRHRRWMGPDPPACDGALGAPRLAARGARAAPWGTTVLGRAEPCVPQRVPWPSELASSPTETIALDTLHARATRNLVEGGRRGDDRGRRGGVRRLLHGQARRLPGLQERRAVLIVGPPTAPCPRPGASRSAAFCFSTRLSGCARWMQRFERCNLHESR